MSEPRPAAAAQAPDVRALTRRDAQLAQRIAEVVAVRKRVVHLAGVLELHRHEPGAHDAEALRESVEKYTEACARNRVAAAPAALACGALTLAPGSSVDGEIAALHREERSLFAQIEVLKNERKCGVRLLTALEECARSRDARNALALEKAREKYESARTN